MRFSSYICVFCDKPAGPVATYRVFAVNTTVLLQVDAAYYCLASTAANGLLQVDAASDYSAPTSHSRGGMGEAQGDPPRHSVEAQHSTERPRRVGQPSVTPFLRGSSLRLSARGATGVSIRRFSEHRNFSTKIAFCRANVTRTRRQQVLCAGFPHPPQKAIFFVNVCILHQACQICFTFSIKNANCASRQRSTAKSGHELILTQTPFCRQKATQN